MSSPSPSPPSQPSQEPRSDTLTAASWWQLSTTPRTAPQPQPHPTTQPTTPHLTTLHAETLSLSTHRAALSSVLAATSPTDWAGASAIAALDVRLRGLILSMAQYERQHASVPEEQAVHAIHAAAEANKTDLSRMLSAAAQLSRPQDGKEPPDYFRGSSLDLDEFDQHTAGLRNRMSDPLPPCHLNKPTTAPNTIPHPSAKALRQLSDTPSTEPVRRPSLLPAAAAASAARPPATASFRTVRGWEDEVKEARAGDKGVVSIVVSDDEKDGDDEAVASKRKRGVAQWGDEDDRGRGAGRRGGDGRYGRRGGRGGRGAAVEEEENDWSANVSTDAKQPFISGNTALALDAAKRGPLGSGGQQAQSGCSGGARPSGLAGSKRKFAPPRPINAVPELAEAVPPMVRAALAGPPTNDSYSETDPMKLERLKVFDPKLVEQVLRDALDNSSVNWDDIAGLVHAKQAVTEAVVWPMKQPELFKGPRAPPKGMLLFGPPGTGKTMIGKAIAKEAGAKFFAISASSLLSKWHGESEKLVRTLFGVARIYQPAVIFVDEIDSLLSQRGDSDAEASRRIKTELLVQMDGAANNNQDSGRLLVLGATNRPQDLDEAARRRMEKRLYIPLPNRAARVELITHQLQALDHINPNKHTLTPADIARLAQLTSGYSGHDLYNLCREAAMVPMRNIYASKAGLGGSGALPNVAESEVPSLEAEHFVAMLERVKSSVDGAVLSAYHEWNKKFGSFPSVVVDEE